MSQDHTGEAVALIEEVGEDFWRGEIKQYGIFSVQEEVISCGGALGTLKDKLAFVPGAQDTRHAT